MRLLLWVQSPVQEPRGDTLVGAAPPCCVCWGPLRPLTHIRAAVMATCIPAVVASRAFEQMENSLSTWKPHPYLFPLLACCLRGPSSPAERGALGVPRQSQCCWGALQWLAATSYWHICCKLEVGYWWIRTSFGPSHWFNCHLLQLETTHLQNLSRFWWGCPQSPSATFCRCWNFVCGYQVMDINTSDEEGVHKNILVY